MRDLAETFERENLFHGTLPRGALEDCLPLNNGSPTRTHPTAVNILDTLIVVMQVQFVIGGVLYDMRGGHADFRVGRYFNTEAFFPISCGVLRIFTAPRHCAQANVRLCE